mmetsp:Transcript_43017/g.135907  ORF Transcript_43017/g.135907 Transcript_43017/m.135907 type:complete len:121 (+) Transcript_43017:446-808(+)
MTLDWTKPTLEQASEAGIDLEETEVVLAAECVWLKELVEPFVDTVMKILNGKHRPRCYCCYRDRAVTESKTFAGMQMVVDAFEARGCHVKLDQRLPPLLLSNGASYGPGQDILLYQIWLA